MVKRNWQAFMAALLIGGLPMLTHAGGVSSYVDNADAGANPDCASGPGDSGPNGPTPPIPPANAGNPINVISGGKFHRETVYHSGGEFPIVYELFYNSRHYDQPEQEYTGRWTGSYSQRVLIEGGTWSNSKVGLVKVFRPDGQVLKFYGSGNTGFKSLDPLNNAGRLFYDGGLGFRRPDGYVEYFDTLTGKNGALKLIVSPTGLKQYIKREVLTSNEKFVVSPQELLVKWEVYPLPLNCLSSTGSSSGSGTDSFPGGSTSNDCVSRIKPGAITETVSTGWKCHELDSNYPKYECIYWGHKDSKC